MRKRSELVDRNGYTPNHLLDTLMEKLGVPSDAALARMLAVPPSTISKVRHKQVAVNSSLLIAAHELTEISIRDLRDLMGDTEARYWLGSIDADRRDSMPQLPSYGERLHRDAPQLASHL